MFEWFIKKGYKIKYDRRDITQIYHIKRFLKFIHIKKDIINNASKYGHVQVLEWFKNSGYEFKYDEIVIDYASRNGYIEILEWFKNSDYELKYNKSCLAWIGTKKFKYCWICV